MPAPKRPRKTTTRKPPQSPSNPEEREVKYYRNLHGCRGNVRIGERSLSLSPRGMRGDIAQVKPGEEWEDSFIANNGLLFEVISHEEAYGIITGQTTNQQIRPETSRDKLKALRKNEIINPKKENLDPSEVVIESEDGHSIKMAEKKTNPDGSSQVFITREGIFPKEQPAGTTPSTDVDGSEGNEGIGPKEVHRPGSRHGPAISKPPENMAPEDVGNWLNEQRTKLHQP